MKSMFGGKSYSLYHGLLYLPSMHLLKISHSVIPILYISLHKLIKEKYVFGVPFVSIHSNRLFWIVWIRRKFGSTIRKSASHFSQGCKLILFCVEPAESKIANFAVPFFSYLGRLDNETEEVQQEHSGS